MFNWLFKKKENKVKQRIYHVGDVVWYMGKKWRVIRSDILYFGSIDQVVSVSLIDGDFHASVSSNNVKPVIRVKNE